MLYGSEHSVARNPESMSVFSHLDFADNLPSLHTAGLFSNERSKCKSTRFEKFAEANRGSRGSLRRWSQVFTSWLKPFQSQLTSGIVWLAHM